MHSHVCPATLTLPAQLRETIVSNSSGNELTIVVPNRGIWGTAGIDGSNIDGWVGGQLVEWSGVAAGWSGS